jgi:hypothetical protein
MRRTPANNGLMRYLYRAPTVIRLALVPACIVAITIAAVIHAGMAGADEGRPKLGPDAVSIQQSHDYLQNHAAPDYWSLSPYYLPQATGSSCSVAAVAMLVNALRGTPPHDEDRLVTQEALLKTVGNRRWAEQTAENGPGVTWDEFGHYVGASLDAFHIDAETEALRPGDGSARTLERLRAVLIENERTDRDIVLAYFNQGVLTGSWDGPHISPIAAYDAGRRRALIMDVDREWYVPYWASDQKLLDALLRPAPASRGRLAGETGGLIRVVLREPR